MCGVVVMSRTPEAGPGRAAGQADLHALVEAAQAGTRRAFTTLVERHQDGVYAFAYALTGNAGSSEEIVQETFVLAWRRLSDLREPDRFHGWLFTTARRLAGHWRRKQRLAPSRPTPS